MLALLAWLGANIFWTLNARESPAPARALESEPRRAAQAIAARHLFGEVPSGPAVVTPIEIKLTGVIAAVRPGETGMALLALEGKPAIAVREGGEVVPGITLHRVLPKQVEIARGAQIQVLMLPEGGKNAAGASLPLPQAAASVPAAPNPPSRRRRVRRSTEDEE